MMKRRVFGMLLSLCLVLAFIPVAAFADNVLYSLTVPYMVNVVKGGSAEPGYAEFRVQLIENTGKDWRSKGGVGIECPVVTTNGVGDYAGKVIINVTSDQGWSQLADGVFVRQQNMGEDGWKYDPAVWYVRVNREEHGDALEVSYDVYPTEYDSEIGVYIPFENDPRKNMTFTNTYTKENADVSALPKTGDSSNLTGWLILLAVSATAVAGAVVYGRRRKNARE